MKTLLLLLSILTLSMNVSAQEDDKNIDVIYLKNKEVYKGIIVKNEMGIVSIQFKRDGEIITMQFQHYDILKIEQAKHEDKDIENNSKAASKIAANAKKTFNPSDLATLKPQTANTVNLPQLEGKTQFDASLTTQESFAVIQQPSLIGRQTTAERYAEDPFSPPPFRRERTPRIWNRKIRGFRGMTRVGYHAGLGKHRNNSFEWIQSLGFQFNPIFYLGGGVGYRISLNNESSMPIFINPRLNLTDNKVVNPYWDVRGGYSVLEATGTFLSTSVGVGFVLGKKGQFAINSGISYSFLDAHFYEKNHLGRYKVNQGQHQIGINIEFEF